ELLELFGAAVGAVDEYVFDNQMDEAAITLYSAGFLPGGLLEGAANFGKWGKANFAAKFFAGPVDEGIAVFKNVSIDEIISINKSFDGTTTLTGHDDTVLANMSYRNGFKEKAATVIRDIAGRHLFDNGNKRTAQSVVELLAKRNGQNIDSMVLRNVIGNVGNGNLSSIDEIVNALSTY
ncbi:MAG: hypothetical protein GY756_20825, partial [bacterium]|nr:hypothetical protein [bacterium]